MALNPGLQSSFTSPKRSQRWYDIAKSVEDSQSRVYCAQSVGCGVVPMVLRNRCQSSVVTDNSRLLSHGYIDGTLLRKENVNAGMTCYAQLHSEPWNDEASFVELPYLSQTGNKHTGSDMKPMSSMLYFFFFQFLNCFHNIGTRQVFCMSIRIPISYMERYAIYSLSVQKICKSVITSMTFVVLIVYVFYELTFSALNAPQTAKRAGIWLLRLDLSWVFSFFSQSLRFIF